MKTKEEIIEKLIEICRQRQIKRMWLYGSVARNDFRDKSDIDIIVEMKNDLSTGQFDFDNYCKIYDDLTSINGLEDNRVTRLQHYEKMIQSSRNKLFKENVERDKILIYSDC